MQYKLNHVTINPNLYTTIELERISDLILEYHCIALKQISENGKL